MIVHRVFFAAAVCCAAQTVAGQLTPVGPFAGDLSEPFNTRTGSALETLEIFGGTALIVAPPTTAEFTRGSIKVEAYSSLNGKELSPHTGPWMVSVLFDDGDPRSATLSFNQGDVHRFGGYFGNNSPTDDAAFRFYAGREQLMATVIADIPATANTWTWHGWESTVPITHVTIKGLSPAPFSGGFIWMDDLELSYETGPAPGACCLSPSGCMELFETDCLDLFGAEYRGDATACIDSNGNGTADACESQGVCPSDCGPSPDGQVDVADLLQLLADWGTASACDVAPSGGDGLIDVGDLLELLAAWGSCL